MDSWNSLTEDIVNAPSRNTFQSRLNWFWRGHLTSSADPAPRGGTLIFSYIRRLGSFFWVQNFEFLVYQKIIFLGFSKKIGGGGGGGDEDFVDIFGGSSQNWTKFRGHFYAF